jgi:intracellular septation protein A
MINVIAKLATGFISTIVFFTAFAMAGDVLVATAVAIAGAATQFVLARTVFRRPDMMTRTAAWFSVALVLLVAVTTLAGVEPSGAATWASDSVVAPVSNYCRPSQQDI